MGEILRRSLGFYRSRPSNWSFNVQAQRFADSELNKNGTAKLPLDRAIMDIFVKPRFRMSRFSSKNVNNKIVEFMQIPPKYRKLVEGKIHETRNLKNFRKGSV